MGTMDKFCPTKKNTTDRGRCAVLAAMRIWGRAQRYGLPVDHPLAVYRDSQGNIKLIDNKHVKIFLQDLAKKVYNITNQDDLEHFTAHSIRVGACVVLHEEDETAETIKFRLRWRSDTFMMYLRNTFKLAARHMQATNRSN